MFSQSNRTVSVLRGTAFAVSVALLGTGFSLHGGAAAATSPFAAMAGSWSGEGTIKMSTGDSERIRCRVTYALEGAKLRQNLRCASDSYRFDLTSAVRSQGGSLSGNWSESTRNLAGNVSGSASAGQIQARVSSPGFSADLSVSTRGNTQAVTISSSNAELQGVNIMMRRS